jgi:hypothetical protein
VEVLNYFLRNKNFYGLLCIKNRSKKVAQIQHIFARVFGSK